MIWALYRLFVGAIGSFAIGAWIAAICVAGLWLYGHQVPVRTFIDIALVAGLFTMLAAEIAAMTR